MDISSFFLSFFFFFSCGYVLEKYKGDKRGICADTRKKERSRREEKERNREGHEKHRSDERRDSKRSRRGHHKSSRDELKTPIFKVGF